MPRSPLGSSRKIDHGRKKLDDLLRRLLAATDGDDNCIVLVETPEGTGIILSNIGRQGFKVLAELLADTGRHVESSDPEPGADGLQVRYKRAPTAALN